jgi:hypothetical protein
VDRSNFTRGQVLGQILALVRAAIVASAGLEVRSAKTLRFVGFAEYLLQVARSSEGRRYRKQPKIDALRQYKEEILEAHR